MVIMNVPEILYELVHESLTNCILLVAASGAVLVAAAGISYGSTKINKIKEKNLDVSQLVFAQLYMQPLNRCGCKVKAWQQSRHEQLPSKGR